MNPPRDMTDLISMIYAQRLRLSGVRDADGAMVWTLAGYTVRGDGSAHVVYAVEMGRGTRAQA